MHAPRLAEFMDGDDIVMAQLGQRTGFARETLRKTRVRTSLRGQNFQRHHAVQRRLPGLINRAHASFAEQADDFKLGKKPRDFVHWRRGEGRAFRLPDRVTRRALFEQARRAKSRQGARRQRRPALGTFQILWHGLTGFARNHTPTSEAKPRKCYMRF